MKTRTKNKNENKMNKMICKLFIVGQIVKENCEKKDGGET